MSGGSATENVIMMKIIMTMMVMIMMMMTMMMMITSGGSATENMIDHDCNGWSDQSDMFTMAVIMTMIMKKPATLLESLRSLLQRVSGPGLPCARPPLRSPGRAHCHNCHQDIIIIVIIVISPLRSPDRADQH